MLVPWQTGSRNLRDAGEMQENEQEDEEKDGVCTVAFFPDIGPQEDSVQKKSKKKSQTKIRPRNVVVAVAVVADTIDLKIFQYY